MPKLSALLLCLLVPAACSVSDAPPDQAATSAVIAGTVRDADGAPLAGVTLEHAGGTTTTDSGGVFEVEAAPGQAAVIIFRKDGFVRGLERIDVSGAVPTTVDVTMVAMAPAVPLDASAGGHVEGVRGSTMNAPPEAFRTKAGATVTGMVDVHLTPLNPSLQAELDAYPGDGLAVDAAGETITLETFGVLDVTVTQGGEELDIVEGMGVEVTVPLPDPMPVDPPPTIALWGFDDAAGVWVEEGIATLELDAGVYRGTITHLSPWNCDQPLEATCIRGAAQEADGDAVPGAYIIAGGVDYIGSSSAVADAAGSFCVPVRKNSEVEITVYHPGGGNVVGTVQSGGADTDVPPVCTDPRCLDVGAFVLDEPADGGTASGGWDGSCGDSDDASLQISLSGAVNESIDWSGDPWLGVCGGLAGAASGGMVGMFFLNDAITQSPLDIFLSLEAGPGDTGTFPLTVMLSEDLLSGVGSDMWLGTCSGELTRNELIAPGLFAVQGTGQCDAPLIAYPDGAPITVDGTFNFGGVVVFGDAAGTSLADCCWGG